MIDHGKYLERIFHSMRCLIHILNSNREGEGVYLATFLYEIQATFNFDRYLCHAQLFEFSMYKYSIFNFVNLFFFSSFFFY